MKFGLEEELIMWIMKTSITQIWMVCHLLHFAKVGQYAFLLFLKGKFSSGIEGALASTLNHDLTGNNYQKLFFVFFFRFFKVYLSNIDSETAEIS